MDLFLILKILFYFNYFILFYLFTFFPFSHPPPKSNALGNHASVTRVYKIICHLYVTYERIQPLLSFSYWLISSNIRFCILIVLEQKRKISTFLIVYMYTFFIYTPVGKHLCSSK